MNSDCVLHINMNLLVKHYVYLTAEETLIG